MSNISCTEFSHLLVESIEARLPLDTPELRGHADQCADCRLAWLDALLLDGAVSQWRGSAQNRLPLVDLTDLVLYRNVTHQEGALSVESEQRAMPFAADANIFPSVGSSPRPSVGAPAAVDQSGRPVRSPRRRFAAIGVAAAVCVAVVWSQAGRRHGTGDLVKQSPLKSQLPTPPPKKHAQIASTTPQLPMPDKRVPAHSIAETPHETIAEDSDPGSFDLASEAARSVTAASVSAPRTGRPAATAAPADDDRWVDDVGRQFEPVGNNLGQAFQFLLEAVPAKKAPAI